MSTEKKKYVVTLEETVTYDVVVEVADRGSATEEAEEAFVQSEDPFAQFKGWVKDRRATYVAELRDLS